MLREGILQVLLLASPMLITAMVLGLIIAILQAASSIQEQTLTFVPKMIAILLNLGFLGGFMLTSMSDFTARVFRLIPEVMR
jgi:flagellar biosynthetic protein FliQ